MRLFIFVSIIFTFSACQKMAVTEKNRTEILSELEYIHKTDQKYADVPSEEAFAQYGRKKAWEIHEKLQDSVNLSNQKRIKHLYKKYGYLGFKEIGKKAATSFWLPIQHADNDVRFQKKMLKALKKEIQINNADKQHYGLLEDRVNINSKKKQRFGSQVIYNEFGQALPRYGLVDSLNVDSLRKEYGLEPLQDYLNELTTFNFEMNKEIFLQNGITEPKLYD